MALLLGNISNIVGVITALIAILLPVTGYTVRSYIRDRRELKAGATLERFKHVRTLLKDWIFQNQVNEAVKQYHKSLLDQQPTTGGYFLKSAEWNLSSPIPLSGLTYVWEDPNSYLVSGGRPLSHLIRWIRRKWTAGELTWPLSENKTPYRRYTDAIKAIEQPNPDKFRNDESYRLLAVDQPKSGQLTLTFGPMKYFDGFNSSGSLEYEATDRFERNLNVGGPYRRSLGDPEKLRKRCCALGVSVLTLRRRRDGTADFYLHSRAGTAGMDGRIGAFPAGEFQPSTGGGMAWRQDLDIWHSIVREYAEEFIGVEEASSQSPVPLKYLTEAPFRQIYEALDRGLLVRVLDIGLDPISLKAGIRVLAVIDEDTFEELFSEMLEENKEGRVYLPPQDRKEGQPPDGWPFTEAQVNEFVSGNNSLTPAVRYLLKAAWTYRQELGLS